MEGRLLMLVDGPHQFSLQCNDLHWNFSFKFLLKLCKKVLETARRRWQGKGEGFVRWRPEEVHVARPVAQGMGTASSAAAAVVVFAPSRLVDKCPLCLCLPS